MQEMCHGVIDADPLLGATGGPGSEVQGLAPVGPPRPALPEAVELLDCQCAV